MDIYSIFFILHLFGLALGAGGAFTSDYLFATSLRDDGKLDTKELRILGAAGRVVWTGLSLSILSGFSMLWMQDFALLSSSVFQAKITIVAIIILNGIAFHTLHLPFLKRLFAEANPALKTAADKKRALFVFASGGISSASWISVIVLGYLRVLPYDYFLIMGAYLFIIAGAIVSALGMKKLFFLRS